MSHWHLKRGWKYDGFVGSEGGWLLSEPGKADRIVCREKGQKVWNAFLMAEHGQLHHAEFGTRDEAMRAIDLQVA